MLNFWEIGNVYADGCDWTLLPPPRPDIRAIPEVPVSSAVEVPLTVLDNHTRYPG